jgi:Nif11 domain
MHTNAERFRAEILADPNLERELTRCRDEGTALALAAQIAAARGYSLGPEELSQALAPAPLTPLSDDELALICGGVDPSECDGRNASLGAGQPSLRPRTRRRMKPE